VPELAVTRRPTVVGDAVGLGSSAVAVDLDELLAEEVHGRVEVREGLLHPVGELLPSAAERAVIVERAGVVAGQHELPVHAVDAARVAREHVADLGLCDEVIEGHGCVQYGRIARDGRREGPTVEMRTLGRSGVQVSEYCLGAMMFGPWGEPDHDESIRIIHRALDAGINFIDTADVYSAGESEEIVGKALVGRREDVVLATKFFAPMGSEPNRRGGSRRWILQEVEHSLRRLGTDYIDLYQIHRPDEIADIDETLGALSDLVHQGKVRYLGHSTFPAEYIVEAQWVSERRNRERFVCEQPPYSILVRGIERAVLPTCARYGIGVIPWSPLAGGLLTGRYRKDQPPPEGSRLARGFGSQHQSERARRAHEARLEVIEDLLGVAHEAGMSLTHLAHAFVLEHPHVSSAIIGPRTMEQLEDALAGADARLDADTLDAIDDIVPPGTDISGGDPWQPPGLATAFRRRGA
jgi:aryl-alcohol dehydrogenase-like predicted oxidoreductase